MTYATPPVFDLNQAWPGLILESPHEITVEDQWRSRWSSIFPVSQRIQTSIEYSKACGFSEIPFPSDLLLNMTLSFALDPLSEQCRYQLEFENARQEKTVYAGDTLKSYSRVEEIRNTSRGDASVLSMTHILVNQRNERIYSLQMRYFFEPLNEIKTKPEPAPRFHAEHYFQQAAEFFTQRYQGLSAFPAAPQIQLTRGDTFHHRSQRPISWSDNLSVSTMLQESHPIHWDADRYGREGLIISGGLVYSLVSAISNRDFLQVLDEAVLHCSHLHPVSPGDQVSAISRILSVDPIDNHLEAVRVKTLGMKNIALEDFQSPNRFPIRLLKEKQRSRNEIETICAQESPELLEKIVLQSVRTLIRPRVVTPVKIQSPD